jgi:hypothetical protein
MGIIMPYLGMSVNAKAARGTPQRPFNKRKGLMV